MKKIKLAILISAFVMSGTVNAATVTSFSEDFSNSTLDSTKWTTLSNGNGDGTVSLSNSVVNLGYGASIDTDEKYTFSGNKIVIESRFAGIGGMRDSTISLVDVSTGDLIRIGDTNYRNWGSYIHGTGAFNFDPNSDNSKMGASTNSYKEYRLTIDGALLTVERGDTLASISEKRTVTLGNSIAGKTFYLSVGTGTDYSPATFDWIKVNIPTIKDTVSWAKTPYSVQCKNNTTAKSVSIAKNKTADYDCEKAGLKVKSGDDVSVTIRGKKY